MPELRLKLEDLELLRALVAYPDHRVDKPDKPGNAPGPIHTLSDKTGRKSAAIQRRVDRLEKLGFAETHKNEQGVLLSVIATPEGIEREKDKQANRLLERETHGSSRPGRSAAADFTKRPLLGQVGPWAPTVARVG